MKFIIIFFHLLLCPFYFAQEITIKTINQEKQNLDNVNIQLIKDNKILDFKTTNSNGICRFTVSESGIYTIKTTSMLYKTKFVEINTSEKTYVEIILEQQVTEIKEVEIKSRPKTSTIKGDTISYNIKAIKDGTERTAEDLIKKLPGVDIDENGRVISKGNIVGQVLVEGNELFGKNHKMATQNITADMIEGVDLWQNYTTISGNQSTALNLKLKDKYKGKITGNAELNYGNKNSYLAHTNLFKFSKIGNLALIADANSIAKDPIGITDFYEMNKQDEIDDTNGATRVETPTFLNNDGKVKSKDNQFAALQYSKSNKKFSVTAFTIFNSAQLQKESLVNRIAFLGQPQTYNFFENRLEKNKGFFGTTQIKFKKNFADKSFIYYNFIFNPTNDNFNQSIERNTILKNSLFENDNTITNTTFGNFLSWNKTFSISKLIVAVSQQKNNYESNLDIFSTENIYPILSTNLTQTLRTDSEKYALDINLKNNFDFATINFNSRYSYKNDSSNLSEITYPQVEKQNLKTHRFTNEILIKKSIGLFDFSGELSSNFLNFNLTDVHYLEKRLQLRYKLQAKANMSFAFDYSNRYKSPEFSQLLNGIIYSRNFSFSQNYNLEPQTLVDIASFRFNFFRFNPDKGNHFFSMLMYEKSNSNLSTDVTNFGMYSQILNILGNFNKRWFLMVSDDRRIANKLTLKTKLTGLYNDSNNFISHQYNETNLKNIEIFQKISSNFKKAPIQFDAGYTYSKSIFNQSLFDKSTFMEKIKISAGIRTNLKKEWLANLLGEYLIQKTQKNTLKNFLLGGQVSYRKQNSIFEYNILFNNLLNLNSFKYINSSINQLGTEESSITALHGFIIGGLKFHF